MDEFYKALTDQEIISMYEIVLSDEKINNFRTRCLTRKLFDENEEIIIHIKCITKLFNDERISEMISERIYNIEYYIDNAEIAEKVCNKFEKLMYINSYGCISEHYGNTLKFKIFK